MARVTGSVVIDRAMEEVFDAVADQTNEPLQPLDDGIRRSHRRPGPLVAIIGRRQERAIWTGLKKWLENDATTTARRRKA